MEQQKCTDHHSHNCGGRTIWPKTSWGEEKLPAASDRFEPPLPSALKGIQLHITKKAKKPLTFVCRYMGCGDAFSSKFNLRRHVMLVHCQKRLYVCDFCCKKFTLFQHLKEHFGVHPDKIARQLIKNCNNSLKSKRSLSKHLPIFFVETDQGCEPDVLKKTLEKFKIPHFVESGQLLGPSVIKNTEKKKSVSVRTSSVSSDMPLLPFTLKELEEIPMSTELSDPKLPKIREFQLDRILQRRMELIREVTQG